MQVIDKTTYREFVAEDGKLARLKGSKDAPHSRGMMPNGTTADDFEEITAERYAQEQAEARKAKAYKREITQRIRAVYDSDDEAAILRQRDTKPDEFAAYNAFVERCKAQAREAVETMDFSGESDE